MKAIKIALFYFISFTWGLPMTLVGVLCSLAMLITGHKPKLFHQMIYFEVGSGWGGFNAGCFFFCSKDSGDSVKRHESGHGIQNLILGVTMPFVVGIPSVIRYWCREWLVRSGRKKYNELPEYSSIWFEHQADILGKKYFR